MLTALWWIPPASLPSSLRLSRPRLLPSKRAVSRAPLPRECKSSSAGRSGLGNCATNHKIAIAHSSRQADFANSFQKAMSTGRWKVTAAFSSAGLSTVPQLEADFASYGVPLAQSFGNTTGSAATKPWRSRAAVYYWLFPTFSDRPSLSLLNVLLRKRNFDECPELPTLFVGVMKTAVD
jgi:hypothetical protein